MNQHNSGNNLETTYPLSLRPYTLCTYICGVEGNKTMRNNFEYM